MRCQECKGNVRGPKPLPAVLLQYFAIQRHGAFYSSTKNCAWYVYSVAHHITYSAFWRFVLEPLFRGTAVNRSIYGMYRYKDQLPRPSHSHLISVFRLIFAWNRLLVVQNDGNKTSLKCLNLIQTSTVNLIHKPQPQPSVSYNHLSINYEEVC